MRAVQQNQNLSSWESAKNEAKASFGNDGMYMEKLVVEPRHIEIQIIGDSKGRVCHLSEETAQYKEGIKLVEESPSPFMTQILEKKWEKQQF